MLARTAPALPEGEELVYEPKWDGFRVLVFTDGDRIRLQSRNGQPLERFFPELHAPLRGAIPDRSVVDGELVVAGERSLDFDALLQRIHPAASRVERLSRETPASFVAFDLLALAGVDLRHLPLAERRRRLEHVLRPGGPVLLTPQTSDPRVAAAWLDRFEGAGIRPLEGGPSFGAGRTPGGPSRWSRGRELDWIPVRPELVCEVRFDRLQGGRFRHAAGFLRWRPDRDPRSCTFDQLEPPAPLQLRELARPAENPAPVARDAGGRPRGERRSGHDRSRR